MTRTTGRAQARLRRALAAGAALAAGLSIAAVSCDAALAAAAKSTAGSKAFGKRTTSVARIAPRKSAMQRTASAQAAPAPGTATDDSGELSFSDEYERAELVERMLAECRGIAYNAYELSRTSGESLWLPAPIQLFVVRVRHPYCAELLRTYAPKQSI